MAMSPPADPNPTVGIGLKCISVVVFVAMQTLIKTVGEEVPPGEVVFFRSFFALIPVIIYLAWLGDLRRSLVTDDVSGHLLRGVVGVTSMILSFYSLARLPYPEWISISYAAPLLTVVFAAIFLKEVVRAYRWTAVAIGLVGVCVVTAPNLSLLSAGGLGGAEALGALGALGSACLAAVAMIQIRRLVKKEKTATIVVYFSLTSSLLALLSVPFGWVLPAPREAAVLIVAGLLGGVGQLLLTASYRYADTSTIAPFEYTSLILAVAIGVFLFGDPLAWTTVLGAAIVVSAGIFIIWREHQLGIERRKARRVSPPGGS
ncbi:DMT family transporter [Aurantimonas sp. 22II-16-19i]|uniref:DMT family transporter n=1 Tax=Aurantimonas sp. 22II-16-19i TaxID=1317114 RepID=UPI0009F7FF6B|nr:DMT family transporter [Aurantimonas sp. 22II-16-19i]ORE89864.1 permease [Aurantimonas sp. 22II-16-19i]